MSAKPKAEVSIGQINVSDNVIRQLTQIWQEVLHLDSVNPDQNYFDLGGDSSLAVLLFAKIEEIFHVELPLATLFEAPTIEELACVLHRDDSSPAGWSPLVAIQPAGSRPVFFCIHGAGGNVLIYRDLALRLGTDQPFYGLQCPGLDGSCPPLTKIEDMAALYVKEIRKKQPRGPYFLGGYCMGGTVAYEVGQQIRAQGEQVALLALFDTMDFSKFPHLSAWEKTYHSIQQLVFHAANFLRLDRKGKAQFLMGKLQVFRNRVPVWRGMIAAKLSKGSGADAAESRLLANIWLTNDRACVNYFPKPYAGTVTDFRPIQQYRVFNKPDVKWDKFAKGGQEVIVLPSYPAGMLLEPFVGHLAEALRKSIDAAIRKYGIS